MRDEPGCKGTGSSCQKGKKYAEEKRIQSLVEIAVGNAEHQGADEACAYAPRAWGQILQKISPEDQFLTQRPEDPDQENGKP